MSQSTAHLQKTYNENKNYFTTTQNITTVKNISDIIPFLFLKDNFQCNMLLQPNGMLYYMLFRCDNNLLHSHNMQHTTVRAT